mmetsp:Transcript_7824/g.18740  ORF Transcript_7824/g.18740 Transcript_7824/m.18740 type:complete len:244 (-) Transcript_7824:811-1542(-)
MGPLKLFPPSRRALISGGRLRGSGPDILFLATSISRRFSSPDRSAGSSPESWLLSTRRVLSNGGSSGKGPRRRLPPRSSIVSAGQAARSGIVPVIPAPSLCMLAMNICSLGSSGKGHGRLPAKLFSLRMTICMLFVKKQPGIRPPILLPLRSMTAVLLSAASSEMQGRLPENWLLPRWRLSRDSGVRTSRTSSIFPVIALSSNPSRVSHLSLPIDSGKLHRSPSPGSLRAVMWPSLSQPWLGT